MDISRISDQKDIKLMRDLMTKNEALELIKANEEQARKQKLEEER